MKKTKSKPAKVGRPSGRKPLLNLRIEPALHDRLKRSSEQSGRTISEETVRRLEQSFSEETALGGSDMRDLAMMLVSTFAFTGQQYATANGHRDWTPRDWMADQASFRAALLSLVERLIFAMPDQSKEEVVLTFEALKGRILTRWEGQEG
ncbi:hypothetical protein AB7M17_007197 [Bradyrhizobium sp. USDA 377]